MNTDYLYQKMEEHGLMEEFKPLRDPEKYEVILYIDESPCFKVYQEAGTLEYGIALMVLCYREDDIREYDTLVMEHGFNTFEDAVDVLITEFLDSTPLSDQEKLNRMKQFYNLEE